MRLTILHAILLVLAAAGSAAAQAAAPDDPGSPFARGRWHFEFAGQAALEAWNYNGSHEELYGLEQGLTYGLRDGLVLRMNQRFIYVSQRGEDGVVLGLTIGVRGRVLQRGRTAAFLQGEVGISHTAVAAPPRGTRYNYLAIGGGGLMLRLNRRAHMVTALQLVHLSNASVKGPGRNPDLEAIGLSLGLNLHF
jgi:opacity protein-like surface antigen